MTDASLKNLETAVEASLSEISTTNRPSPMPLRQSSDMDKLMATGARLLREKINEHIAAVSAHEKARIELADSFRVQMERLRIDAEDRLRLLDAEHAKNIGAIEALIDKLKILRGA